MKWKTQGDHRRWRRRVESWAACDPGPDSPRPSLRGGLCERTGPSLYGAAGLSKRIFSKRKRPLGSVWGILLKQQLQSPLYPAFQCSHEDVGGIKPKSEALGRVRNSEGLWAHIRGIRESAHLAGA